MRAILAQPGLMRAALLLPSQSLALHQDGFEFALLLRDLPDWANLP